MGLILHGRNSFVLLTLMLPQEAQNHSDVAYLLPWGSKEPMLLWVGLTPNRFLVAFFIPWWKIYRNILNGRYLSTIDVCLLDWLGAGLYKPNPELQTHSRSIWSSHTYLCDGLPISEWKYVLFSCERSAHFYEEQFCGHRFGPLKTRLTYWTYFTRIALLHQITCMRKQHEHRSCWLLVNV